MPQIISLGGLYACHSHYYLGGWLIVSQYFIRRGAGYGPFKRAMSQLHEPPIISAIYGAWYVIMLCIGLHSSIDPPRTIEAAAGDTLMTAIAGLLALSGAWGVITVATGDPWLERFAVGFGLLGWGFYELVSLWLWASATSGNRGMATLGILGAGLFTGFRWVWIRNVSFSERKKRRLQRRRLAQQ